MVASTLCVTIGTCQVGSTIPPCPWARRRPGSPRRRIAPFRKGSHCPLLSRPNRVPKPLATERRDAQSSYEPKSTTSADPLQGPRGTEGHARADRRRAQRPPDRRPPGRRDGDHGSPRHAAEMQRSPGRLPVELGGRPPPDRDGPCRENANNPGNESWPLRLILRRKINRERQFQIGPRRRRWASSARCSSTERIRPGVPP